MQLISTKEYRNDYLIVLRATGIPGYLSVKPQLIQLTEVNSIHLVLF